MMKQPELPTGKPQHLGSFCSKLHPIPHGTRYEGMKSENSYLAT